eukprot:gene2548-3510_t
MEKKQEVDSNLLITTIDSDILRRIICDEESNKKMNGKHSEKYLFFFPCSLGCPYCQGTLEDLYTSKIDELNETITPLICHEEDQKSYETFLNYNERTKKYSKYRHLERSTFINLFNIKREKNELNLWNFATNGITEYARLSSLGISPIYEIMTKETTGILPCIFITKDFRIVFEYRKSSKYQRFDFDLIKNFDYELEIKMKDLEEDDFCFIETTRKKKSNPNQQVFSPDEENNSFLLSDVPMVETERSSHDFRNYIKSMKRISSNKSLDWTSDDDENISEEEEEDHPDILNHLQKRY